MTIKISTNRPQNKPAADNTPINTPVNPTEKSKINKNSNDICLLNTTHNLICACKLSKYTPQDLINGNIVCSKCIESIRVEYSRQVNNASLQCPFELYLDIIVGSSLSRIMNSMMMAKCEHNNQLGEVTKLRVKQIVGDYEASVKERTYTPIFRTEYDALRFLQAQGYDLMKHEVGPIKYIVELPKFRNFTLLDESRSLKRISTDIITDFANRYFLVLR